MSITLCLATYCEAHIRRGAGTESWRDAGGNGGQLGIAAHFSFPQVSGITLRVTVPLALSFLLVSLSQLFASLWPVTRRVLAPNLNAHLQDTPCSFLSSTLTHQFSILSLLSALKSCWVCGLLLLPQWLLQCYELLCFFVSAKCQCCELRLPYPFPPAGFSLGVISPDKWLPNPDSPLK